MNRNAMELLAELSDPDDAVVRSLSNLDGELILLGAEGFHGHALALMAKRAFEEAGKDNRVIAASLFSDESEKLQLEADDIQVIDCDLTQMDAVRELPDAANVIYMLDQQLGEEDDMEGIDPATDIDIDDDGDLTDVAQHANGTSSGLAWLINVHVPAVVATRYADSCIVVKSSAADPLMTNAHSGDVSGEYAHMARGRERIFDFFSREHGTPTALLRIDTPASLGSGVLFDLASKVFNDQPINLSASDFSPLWATDSHRFLLRALEHCQSPPAVFNVAGAAKLTIKQIAEQFGEAFGMAPSYYGDESGKGQLTHAGITRQGFGEPEYDLEFMVNRIAGWLLEGNAL